MVKREIFAGADVLLASPDLLSRLASYPSVGMVTNPTGITKAGDPVYEKLSGRIPLAALFSPEHGVRGEMQAGAAVDEYADGATGLPVYSLYGPGKAAAEERIGALGCLLFDIQDRVARQQCDDPVFILCELHVFPADENLMLVIVHSQISGHKAASVCLGA